MPDYRLIHRRALRGEKVGALTDFERGVWLAYLLISDDYGVMPFDAGELARAIWLKGKSQKAVQKALERVRDVGLIQTWTHQGAVYCYAQDWQEWQNVRHPRGTIEPCPPPEIVERCKPKTRALFADHSRNNAEELPQDDGGSSGELRQMPRLARAGGRETLTLTANATAGSDADAAVDRVQAFIDTYRAKHLEVLDVAYLGNDRKDYEAACKLVAAFDDEMLLKLMQFWFHSTDDFATNGTRTVTKFLSRASRDAEELKAKRLA